MSLVEGFISATLIMVFYVIIEAIIDNYKRKKDEKFWQESMRRKNRDGNGNDF